MLRDWFRNPLHIPRDDVHIIEQKKTSMVSEAVFASTLKVSSFLERSFYSHKMSFIIKLVMIASPIKQTEYTDLTKQTLLLPFHGIIVTYGLQNHIMYTKMFECIGCLIGNFNKTTTML